MGVRCKRAVTSYLQRSWKIVVLGGDSQLASFEFEAARKIREIQAKVNATVSSILAKVELGPDRILGPAFGRDALRRVLNRGRR